jgi:sterol desaturase/sphingolipid hydroxylase (fatty acid hydroxylase superfamily)
MTNLINYAIPGFIALISAEAIFSAVEKRDLYNTKDALTSMAMGFGNAGINLFAKVIMLVAYDFCYQYRWFDIPSDAWWAWLLVFILDDFSYYWSHRADHSIRWFWASHVVHHSSQHYNLSTAVRQTWTNTLTGYFIFYLWLPLLGFEPIMAMTAHSIAMLYQFLIHTEVVGKLHPFIEYIFVTPSHHRVHHSSDVKYLDKNHGGGLIIWDRLFGTFQEEEERPTYGLVTNIHTHNLLKIAFHEWADMWQDVARSGSLRNALGYVFGPPGWSHDGSKRTTRQLRNAHQQAIPARPEDLITQA